MGEITRKRTAAPARKSAPPTPPTASAAALLKAVPLNAKTIAKRQALAEGQHALYVALGTSPLDNASDYEYVDALLSEQCRLDDAEIAMRKSATGPLYGVIKTIEGWFRPLGVERAFAISTCKALMAGYRVAQLEATQAATALAAKAITAGDSAVAVEALELASDIAAPTEARASTSFVWTVDRVNVDLMPTDATMTVLVDGVPVPMWLPNVAAFAEIAKAHPGTAEEPPIVQGVVFKRAARIAGRK